MMLLSHQDIIWWTKIGKPAYPNDGNKQPIICLYSNIYVHIVVPVQMQQRSTSAYHISTKNL